MEKPTISLALLAGVLSFSSCDKTEKTDFGDTGTTVVDETREKVDRQIKTAEVPPSPTKRCPEDMVDVRSKFCIDRYESSLVDSGKHRQMSPYYSPDRGKLLRDHAYWLSAAGRSEKPENSSWEGPLLDSIIKVPSPNGWQMQEEVQPLAVSERSVLPNGYLTFDLARQACVNAGKRLCSKEEWEEACRGENNFNYPYGKEYKQRQCNVFRWLHPAEALHGNAGINHLDPRLHLVEEKPGQPLLRKTGATETCVSRWGVDGIYDMVGNLDEWVDYRTPTFKGGFYSRSTKKGCDATFGKGHSNSYYDYSLGVRCCKD